MTAVPFSRLAFLWIFSSILPHTETYSVFPKRLRERAGKVVNYLFEYNY